MSKYLPPNEDVVREFEPFFPLLERVAIRSMSDHYAAMQLLGIPRPVERSGELHRAMRENLRRLCDIDEELLELREEPDGQGLDYVVSYMNPISPKALRWGRVPSDGRIRRNRTKRTKRVQSTGFLFDEMDEKTEGYPTYSLGYTLRDDYVEAGIPQWWIGELLLMREKSWECEVIARVASFSKPEHRADEYETPTPIIVAREEELTRWQQMIDKIKRRPA